ncbi:uroporphyrinogen decarboxylase/cobalamine-independent methonine synthase family protein [Frigoriglobus tundricola]|uniref:hypothetical protein n=1 Tax=Frigoriglobus tundricola TaxID=2774151 RepID=UPI00148EB355|nr:hypothetical protein [Frigoriglobus tundricola]
MLHAQPLTQFPQDRPGPRVSPRYHDITREFLVDDLLFDGVERADLRRVCSFTNAFAAFRYTNKLGSGGVRHPLAVGVVAGGGGTVFRQGAALPGAEQLWVDPDRGLKTRKWDEMRPPLVAMIDAARALHARVPAGSV